MRMSYAIRLVILTLSTIVLFQLIRVNVIRLHQTKNYSYYVCTQIMSEPEGYLIEWIEYQLNVIGFKNICLINVGENLNSKILSRFSIGVINKQEPEQDFKLCLECFNPPMKPSDLLFIQDVDEFLNVKQADVISKNYDRYDKFHFQEIRFGYIHETDDDMKNKSLLETNVYRKPHKVLGEDTSESLKNQSGCHMHKKWYSCADGFGKEMIKVGKIEKLDVHFHRSNRKDIQTKDTLDVDVKSIRLNHYIMRTRDDAIEKGRQWNKLPNRMSIVNSNDYFKVIFDDTIKQSKRLI